MVQEQTPFSPESMPPDSLFFGVRITQQDKIALAAGLQRITVAEQRASLAANEIILGAETSPSSDKHA